MRSRTGIVRYNRRYT